MNNSDQRRMMFGIDGEGALAKQCSMQFATPYEKANAVFSSNYIACNQVGTFNHPPNPAFV